MSQISRRFIKPAVLEKIRLLLLDCIVRCRDQEITAAFIDALLTNTEKIVIAKRIAIALMILKGRTSEEIQSTLKVSGQTVWTVGGWLRTRGAGFHKLLEDVMKSDERQEGEHKDALDDTKSSPIWFGPTSWKTKRETQWKRVRKTRVSF